MSIDIANLTLCHNIAWQFLPSLFRQSSITRLPGFTSIKLAEENWNRLSYNTRVWLLASMFRLPGFTSIKLAEENWNRLSYDTRIQFLVQLQLAPAACEGAHTPTIHHNMCPGARLHTICTPPTYHTIRYPTELLTDWVQPLIGLSSRLKDYDVSVCPSVPIKFNAAPNRRCRKEPKKIKHQAAERFVVTQTALRTHHQVFFHWRNSWDMHWDEDIMKLFLIDFACNIWYSIR
jgi:hypothetical protein